MIRSKGKALTRARKQVQEGDEELAKLLAHASELDHNIDTIEARIVELEVRVGVCRTYYIVPEVFSPATSRYKSGINSSEANLRAAYETGLVFWPSSFPSLYHIGV